MWGVFEYLTRRVAVLVCCRRQKLKPVVPDDSAERYNDGREGILQVQKG
jgi:hypothetical protein